MRTLILTWSSHRPKMSMSPSGRQRQRSPVLYIIELKGQHHIRQGESFHLPVIRKWVSPVFLRRLLRQMHIALGDSRATSPHDSRLSHGNFLLILVEHVDPVVWCGLADGQGFSGDMEVHRVDDGGLCWATAVVVFAVSGPRVGQPESVLVRAKQLWRA